MKLPILTLADNPKLARDIALHVLYLRHIAACRLRDQEIAKAAMEAPMPQQIATVVMLRDRERMYVREFEYHGYAINRHLRWHRRMTYHLLRHRHVTEPIIRRHKLRRLDAHPVTLPRVEVVDIRDLLGDES